MPFALIFVGVILVVVGFRGTQDAFFGLLKGDFTGSGNFFYWVVSIGVIGAVGYIPRLKGLSNAFLVLIIVVLFLSNKGFFAQFNAQLKSGTMGSGTTGASNATNSALPAIPAIPSLPAG